MGPPTNIWKLPDFQSALHTAQVKCHMLRACALKQQHDPTQTMPSHSHFKYVTNLTFNNPYGHCQCSAPYSEHVLDWYGNDEKRALWRLQVTTLFT